MAPHRQSKMQRTKRRMDYARCRAVLDRDRRERAAQKRKAAAARPSKLVNGDEIAREMTKIAGVDEATREVRVVKVRPATARD